MNQAPTYNNVVNSITVDVRFIEPEKDLINQSSTYNHNYITIRFQFIEKIYH